MALQLSKRGVALGLVVGLLAGAAGGALATSGGSKATTTTTTTPSTTKQGLVDAFLSDLAGRLGIDVSKLTDAIKGAAIDQINQAVKDGRLTQDEANAIIARINSGDFGPGFGFRLRLGFGGPGFGHMGFARMDVLATAASYLGLTEAQLQTQLQSGKSLADIAKATSGKTVAGLEDALVAAATKAIDANTNLTADQKAQLIARVKTMVDALVNRTPGTMGHRGRMGFGLMQGGMMGGGRTGPAAPAIWH
jgi:hypothetical protein